ncbi:MAG TPA: hypothetical protein PK514_06675 [Spirochaetota bacterium]|nr:hypothetical protein [Spirochaetota bacterium]
MQKVEDTISGLWRKSRFASYFYHGIDLAESGDLPTLGLMVYTSRLTLFFNPEFTSQLTVDELTGLLVHEMLHVVLNHEHRGNRDQDIYKRNLAQDMVINSYLKENRKTFFSRKSSYIHDTPELILPAGLPVIPGTFFRDTGNYDPVWEDVYSWLREQSREEIRKFSFNENEEGSGNTLANVEPGIRQMQQTLNSLDLSYNTAPEQNLSSFKKRDALIFEKPDGDPLSTGVHIMKNRNEIDPSSTRLNHLMLMAEKDELCREERIFGEIRGLIESVKKRDMSWSEKIRTIVDSTSQSDEYEYTYHRFNKRYFSQGIYSPGRSFKYRNVLTVAVDVSGSMVMKPGDIEAAFGIIEDLLPRFRVCLLCIDETVFIPEKQGDMFTRSADNAKPYEYKKGDWRFIKTGSSGTTYFEPLFNTFMQGHRELLIVITDGFIYDLDRLRKYHNTLWLISEHRDEPFTPAFGRIVKIESVKPAGLHLNPGNAV